MVVALAGLLTVADRQPAYAADIIVGTTEDKLGVDGDCSLRAAILAANTDEPVDGCPAGSGADTILLPPGVYTLSIANVSDINETAGLTGDLDITTDITIMGFEGIPAAETVIDAAGIDRVFDVSGSSASLTLSGITVRGGGNMPLPSDGGGIRVEFRAHLTLVDSVVTDNVAGSNGGGIYNLHATLNVVRSTVSGNTADGVGGGIALAGRNPNLDLMNSTVSGNTSLGNGGGGIHFTIMDPDVSVLTITNSTITNNTNGGIRDISAGDLFLFVKNTIVANQASGADCNGLMTTLGHNLDSDDTCYFIDPDDIPGVDPLLGPLQDNGGPTHTHAVLEGSPAIDSADDTACPATDQRGVIRPQGAQCDIGAYEFEGPEPTETPIPTSTATPTPTATATPTAVQDPVVGIDVAELIGVADAPALRNAFVEIAVTEAVGILDAPALRSPVVEIAVGESIGVVDQTALQTDLVTITVSEPVGVTDDPQIDLADLLLPPSDLVAEAIDSDRIVLFWTDNATGEQGFELQRDSGLGFETIATLPPDSTFWDDMGLQPDTLYAYRVRAFADGVFTDWSNVAFAMTFPDVGPPVIDVPFIIVNSTGDTNERDGVLTLREAMLIATGELSIASLDGGECAQIPGGSFDGVCTSTSSFGAAAADRIAFSTSVFPPDAPATIALTDGLPDLSTGNDMVTSSFFGFRAGVIIDGGGVFIQCIRLTSAGNRISGLQVQGCTRAISLLGRNNTVGGLTSDLRNIIVDNYTGIQIHSSRNAILGNYVGINGDGSAIPNQRGIIVDGGNDNVIGGQEPGAGNVISGNDVVGIGVVRGETLIVDGNYIGTDPTGTVPVPNAEDGIHIVQSQVNVGSIDAGNVIAFNLGNGIYVAHHISNNARAVVRGNSIHSNGGAGIFHDSFFRLPAPTLTGAFSETFLGPPMSTWLMPIAVAGEVRRDPDTTYIVDFYASPTCGNGEGATFLGSIDVTPEDSLGTIFEAVLGDAGAVDRYITVIMSRLDHEFIPPVSSQFSECIEIVEAPAVDASDMRVRCTATPVWPQPGDTVTIRAEALDNAVRPMRLPDVLEVWVDSTLVGSSTSKHSSFEHSFVASTEGPLAYSCAVRDTNGDAFSGWRTTTVGFPDPEDFGDKAVPVVITNTRARALDILFIADDESYSGSLDPAFLEDVGDAIRNAYYGEEIFLENQLKFNFWVAFHTGLAGGYTEEMGCILLPPDGWYDELAFADAGAILHTKPIRDCAAQGRFSGESSRPRVIMHETAHRPFGLADEYCCDGGYFEQPTVPNVYRSQEACEDDAPDVGRTASDCRTWRSSRNDNDYWTSDPWPDDMMVRQGPFRALDLRRINWVFDRCDEGLC